RPDVDPPAAGLDDVVLVDLPTVRDHAPRATAVEVERARAIVADGIGTFDGTVAERRMDDAVVALRSRVADAVNAELERLPAEGAVSAERAAQALRRLAARLVHEPTVRARAAGREGRTEEHLRALEQVLGVAVAAPDPTLASAEAPPPATVPAEPERAR
ncbi:hypothetical protein ACFSBG_10670, partial [Georgenia yuyongxinii]